MSFEPGVMTV